MAMKLGLRNALLLGSVLSGTVALTSQAQAELPAGCVVTTGSVDCSNGTTARLSLHPPFQVNEEFALNLNSYHADGDIFFGGWAHETVTLSNGSSAKRMTIAESNVVNLDISSDSSVGFVDISAAGLDPEISINAMGKTDGFLVHGSRNSKISIAGRIDSIGGIEVRGGPREINVDADIRSRSWGVRISDGSFSSTCLIQIAAGATIDSSYSAIQLDEAAADIRVDGTLRGFRGIDIFRVSNPWGYYNYLAAPNAASITVNGKVIGTEGAISMYLLGGDAHINIGSDGYVEGQSGSGIGGRNNGYGKTTIHNAGTVVGLTSGVNIYAPDGTSITNSGLIGNLSLLETDLAIVTDLSGTVIDNQGAGVIRGRVTTGAGAFDDHFANAGLWQTGGVNDFGGGADEVSNSGLIRFGSHGETAETATFSNLERLVNEGMLSGVDQVAGDDAGFDGLEVSGDYVGHEGAVLGLDAFLGGPGSQADRLTVRGNASGSTAIEVHNINSGSGQANDDGIVLVDVKGAAEASSFHLANGPVSAGLFDYDLSFADTGTGKQFLLKSAPGTGSAETVAAVDGVQGLWQGGTDAWTRHQGDLRDRAEGGVQITAVSDPAIPETQRSTALWASARGDWTQRASQASFNYLNNTNSYSAGYDQRTTGLDGGADFVADLGEQTKALFGIVAGYQTSKLAFRDSANSIALEGGSVGAYGSLVSHGAFADLMVKQDWLGIDYSVPGTGTARTHGRSLGASADLGYRFGGTSGFIEPMVSFSSTSTKIGSFELGGGTVSPGSNITTRIGAGVRLGITDTSYALSLTARAWKGVGGGNRVNVSGTGLGVTVTDPGIGKGLSGEISANLAYKLSPAAQMFAGGSVQFAKGITSEAIHGGVRVSW